MKSRWYWLGGSRLSFYQPIIQPTCSQSGANVLMQAQFLLSHLHFFGGPSFCSLFTLLPQFHQFFLHFSIYLLFHHFHMLQPSVGQGGGGIFLRFARFFVNHLLSDLRPKIFICFFCMTGSPTLLEFLSQSIFPGKKAYSGQDQNRMRSVS